MRRTVAVVACLVAILGFLAPAAHAQAPVPKVTINGLFDQITSGGYNIFDGDLSRRGDREWYARTRFRPDFTFQVGRTKAVMGLEMDVVYGQTGNCGSGPTKGGGVFALGNPCAGEKNGSTSGSSLNTDVAGIIEFKWLYTEFDLTGKDSILPFIPVTTVARAGLQPFQTYGGLVGGYRGTYAQGDFPGLSAVTEWAPNLKTGLAYVMIDEALGTFNRAGVGTSAGTATIPTRGDDFAVIFSPEFTPFKGLDIKPMYSYLFAQGTTSSSARQALTNITTSSTFGAFTPGGSIAGATAYQLRNSGGAAVYANGDPDQHENRHTIGLDARWSAGPFKLSPTILYQFGKRSDVDYTGPTGSGFNKHSVEADISAWLVDIEGGFQLGPLLLEGRAAYSTGNKARDNLSKSVKYFQPLDLDTGYWAGWAAITALGIDYFNGGNLANMANNVGYDRYGIARFGLRATYSLTPELAVYTSITPTWTAEKVDTDTSLTQAASSSNNVIRTCARKGDVGGTCFVKGDSRYLGTEVDLGTTWRFAPNTAFDLQGAYLFAGHALDTRVCGTPGVGAGVNVSVAECHKEDAHGGWTIAARVRLAF
jgi:hypothetical protein